MTHYSLMRLQQAARLTNQLLNTLDEVQPEEIPGVAKFLAKLLDVKSDLIYVQEGLTAALYFAETAGFAQARRNLAERRKLLPAKPAIKRASQAETQELRKEGGQ